MHDMLSVFKKISTFNKWELEGKTIKFTTFEDDNGKLLVGTDVNTGIIYILDQDVKEENEVRNEEHSITPPFGNGETFNQETIVAGLENYKRYGRSW